MDLRHVFLFKLRIWSLQLPQEQMLSNSGGGDAPMAVRSSARLSGALASVLTVFLCMIAAPVQAKHVVRSLIHIVYCFARTIDLDHLFLCSLALCA